MRKRGLHVVAAVLGLGLLVIAAGRLAADPDFPAFTAPVVDTAHVLPAADAQALDDKLLAFQKKTGTQFAVAIVPSLDGEEIEPYANALFRKWGVGTKDVNNGLLLVVAVKEHRLRFEVGYGLEGTMTDVQANLIITNAMVPQLKAGDSTGAIKVGVDDAIKVLGGDAGAVPTQQPVGAADQPLDPVTAMIFGGLVLLVVFVFLVIVIRAVRRGGSGWTWTAGTGAGIGSSWSNDDHSSSGGGGFSGGGGGDSGGGGASGSW